MDADPWSCEEALRRRNGWGCRTAECWAGDGSGAYRTDGTGLEEPYAHADAPDDDTDASTVEWFNGTTSLGTGATLAAAFLGGDAVTCTVTPDDGEDTGSPVSVNIAIDNTPPVLDSVSLSFRYTAGYTPPAGQQKDAPVVRVLRPQLVGG